MMAALDMQGLRLSELLAGLQTVPVALDIAVQGLSLDSRSVQPGDLFFATAGSQVHGLRFAADAVAAGAVAVIYEPVEDLDEDPLANMSVPVLAVPQLGRHISHIAARFYAEPSAALFAVGVTGTDGKTSCSHFIAQALQQCGVTSGLLGTLGYGLVGQLHAATHTTPDPITVQAELADLCEQGARAVAMEVSSHALDQARAAAVQFDVAVLTQLSRDHLDYHGDMAAYAGAKRRLFEHPGLQAAVLNVDDVFGRELLDALAGRVTRVAYSLEPGLIDAPVADHWVAARSIETSTQGLSVQVVSSWGEGQLASPLLGRFNAANLLAALAVLLVQGQTFAAAMEALSKVTTVPGRMEALGGGDVPLVVIDYAHTPRALEQVLQALRPHCAGHLWCVFGAGGERDSGKRPLMGEVAERLADHVWLTDDNPRHEDPTQIVLDILAGVQKPDSVYVERDRATAIRHAVQAASSDDIVLIAGKGHEDYQLIGDQRLSFSDRDCVEALLKEGGS